MRFTITFCTDNDPFRENMGAEVEHILSQVQDQLFDHSPFGDKGFGRLKDSNGDRVGFWALQEERK